MGIESVLYLVTATDQRLPIGMAIDESHFVVEEDEGVYNAVVMVGGEWDLSKMENVDSVTIMGFFPETPLSEELILKSESTNLKEISIENEGMAILLGWDIKKAESIYAIIK